MSLTIDASVFVAGIRTQEPHHAESREFFRQLIVRDIGVICPTIVLRDSHGNNCSNRKSDEKQPLSKWNSLFVESPLLKLLLRLLDVEPMQH